MKWIAILVLGFAFCAGSGRAQDAANEERFNKLSGQLEDMRSSQEALGRRIDALVKELESVRGQVDKPSGNFASEEDVRRLTEAVREIDRKRMDDYEKIRGELKNLGKSISASAPAMPKKTPPTSTPETSGPEKSNASDKGFEYQVKKGDTLSIIVQAYRDSNIKITTDQILKANPGLKPEKMRVGQKIFIPAPQS